MNSIKFSVLANFLGTAWVSLLSFLLVPYYIHALGVEAYGLIGFFVSLRTIFGLLNFGLSPATNREISRRTRLPEKAWESLNLVRSLESVFYAMGLFVALVLFIASNWIAESWINASSLPPGTVKAAVTIFGLTFMARWPLELYVGVFRGLERQPLLNAISSLASLVTGLGAVIVLQFVSRTIIAFLLWQALASFLELAAMAGTSWMLLRGTSPHRPRFDLPLLKTIWRYSAGMTGVSLFAIILKQMDRILISKLLPLDSLGFYTVASSTSGGLGNLVNPVSKSIFPRFSALVAAGDWSELSALYHKSAQTTAFFAAPAAMALIFFPHEILLLWTRSQVVADNAWVTMSVLSVAALMNSFMGPPQALNLASGQTSIPLFTNAIGVVILLPLSFFLIGHHGILGAGISWLIFNCGYLFIVPWFIHRHVLPGHLGKWYLRDTAPFVALALVLFFAGRLAASWLPHPWMRMGVAGAALLIYGTIGINWCPPGQLVLAKVLKKVKKSFGT
ncbi:MAG TPA: oligosaccharide flippase family protein [Fibrobacteria bacterium]|nr:oligosaccharide flippase family protein [Fibrobacteria bacterium]